MLPREKGTNLGRETRFFALYGTVTSKATQIIHEGSDCGEYDVFTPNMCVVTSAED